MGGKRKKRGGIASSQLSSPDSSQLSTPGNSQAQSVSTLSQNASAIIPADISVPLLNRLANDCTYYLLVASKKKIPIKKADIIKNVLKDNPKAFKLVMIKAERNLKEVFGMQLSEVDKKGFVLTNALSPDDDEDATDVHLESERETAIKGLIFIVLSMIYMNENAISENSLWQALSKFGLNPNVPHSLFGNLKKVLTQELVRQLYLEYTPIANSDPTTYEFTWGARAKLETNKLEMLSAVSQIYGGGMRPEDWKSQYKEAQDAQESQEGSDQ